MGMKPAISCILMNFVIGGFHALVQVLSKDGSKLAIVEVYFQGL